jgi:hypothetical protein
MLQVNRTSTDASAFIVHTSQKAVQDRTLNARSGSSSRASIASKTARINSRQLILPLRERLQSNFAFPIGLSRYADQSTSDHNFWINRQSLLSKHKYTFTPRQIQLF